MKVVGFGRVPVPVIIAAPVYFAAHTGAVDVGGVDVVEMVEVVVVRGVVDEIVEEIIDETTVEEVRGEDDGVEEDVADGVVETLVVEAVAAEDVARAEEVESLVVETVVEVEVGAGRVLTTTTLRVVDDVACRFCLPSFSWARRPSTKRISRNSGCDFSMNDRFPP